MKYLISGLLLLSVIACSPVIKRNAQGKSCNDLVENIKYDNTYVVDHGFFEGMTFTAEGQVSYYVFSGKLSREGHFEMRAHVDGRSLFQECRGE